MSDMLVNLYELPETAGVFSGIKSRRILIRRPLVPEKHIIVQWVSDNFLKGWADEAEMSFSNKPVSCFIALKNKKIIGFSCYDATMKGFMGPIGVEANFRKSGVGKALLLKTLYAMKDSGYAYAIIGWAGPVDFFKKTVHASVIKGSEPGIYRGMLTEFRRNNRHFG